MNIEHTLVTLGKTMIYKHSYSVPLKQQRKHNLRKKLQELFFELLFVKYLPLPHEFFGKYFTNTKKFFMSRTEKSSS